MIEMWDSNKVEEVPHWKVTEWGSNGEGLYHQFIFYSPPSYTLQYGLACECAHEYIFVKFGPYALQNSLAHPYHLGFPLSIFG